MPTGPGPCPALEKIGDIVSGSFAGGYQMVVQVAVPHGWTSATVTYYRDTDGSPRQTSTGFQFEDATGTIVGPGYLSTLRDLDENTTYTQAGVNLSTQANRDAVRTISLWTRPVPTDMPDWSVVRVQNVSVSAIFLGTCQDIELVLASPLVTILG